MSGSMSTYGTRVHVFLGERSRCTEISGRYERSLHTLRCGGGCQHGRFCSSACLKQAWPVHRLVCKKNMAATL